VEHASECRPKKLRSRHDHLIAQRRTVANSSRVHTELSLTRRSSAGRRRSPWLVLTLALLATLVAGESLTGCTSTASKDKNLLRNVQPPQPVLNETAVYGGGALKVECWLGPTVRLKKAHEQGSHSNHNGQSRAEPESTDAPFKQGGSKYSPQEIDQMFGHVNYQAVVPPRSALTFWFTNPGAQPITFTIVDVNSALGDFAPRPETLTVAPGSQGSIDPMLTNLDDNYEELDVSLIVKIGAQKETHILKLHRLPESRP
jgi:hypothetical protein